MVVVPAFESPDRRMRVNKRELARVLDVSLPTIDALIDRYPDLPVEQRGNLGRAWEFDAEKVVAFLQQKRREDAEQLQAKSELLKQFTLPMGELAPDDCKAAISPSQRKQIAEALRIERRLALESGLLVPTSEIRQDLAVALSSLGRTLDALPLQLGRRFNLPDEIVRALRDSIDDARREAVRNIGHLLKPDVEHSAG